MENNERTLRSNTHWKLLNFFLSINYEFWGQESKIASSDEYYSSFVTFLDRLKTRCTTYFPLEKFRATIRNELGSSLSLARALSFIYKRTGDVRLYEQFKLLKRSNREELTKLRANYVSKTLREREREREIRALFVNQHFLVKSEEKLSIEQCDRSIYRRRRKGHQG